MAAEASMSKPLRDLNLQPRTRLVDSRMPAHRASLDQPYLNAHARVEHARRHRRAFFYHANPPA